MYNSKDIVVKYDLCLVFVDALRIAIVLYPDRSQRDWFRFDSVYQHIIQTIVISCLAIIKTYIHTGLPAVILFDPIDFNLTDRYNQYAIVVDLVQCIL